MDPTAYNAFVARHERLATTDPAALRRRGFLFVALGYLYVLGILFGSLGLGAGIIYLAVRSSTGVGGAVKIAIPLLVLSWIIARALWVKVLPPGGTPLDLATTPQLAARIDALRRSLSAPRPDVVLLTGDFNASVTQVPRLGIFGWHRTYLSLGVPLMYGLDRAQLDAVLAHEFAHLSSAHPKSGLWIYRVGSTWGQLLASIEEANGGVRWIFQRFFRWYVPRLQAFGFAMSRRDEYEADRDAAQVAGAGHLGAALIALEVRGSAMHGEYWPEVWRRAEQEPEAPTDAWTSLPRALAHRVADDRVFDQLLRRKAVAEDTHPSLAQRLTALGVLNEGRLSDALIRSAEQPLGVSAAEEYLGGAAHAFMEQLDAEWRSDCAGHWRERHAELRTSRDRANGLLAKERMEPLAPTEAWELAGLLEELGADPLPYLEQVVAGDTAHPGAHYHLGRRLLQRGDPAGIPLLERAITLDDTLAPIGSSVLRQYFIDAGDTNRAEAAEWTGYTAGERLEAAAGERNEVTRRDTLVAATVEPEALAELRELAARFDAVDAVWVARKETKYYPERPMLVIVLEPSRWRWRSGGKADGKLARAFVDGVTMSDTDVLVVVLTSNSSWLRKKVRKAPGLLVYSRGAKAAVTAGTG